MLNYDLHDVDKENFDSETGGSQAENRDVSDVSSVGSGASGAASVMLSRFDNTQVMESDLILTTRRSNMREVLVKQLKNSPELIATNFNFAASTYF